MDEKDLTQIVGDCEFDTCLNDDDDSKILCGSAERLVDICNNKYEIQIADWRDADFCREWNC